MSEAANPQSGPEEDLPAWLTLPPGLVGASTKTLAGRYHHLAEIKLAGETRVGRHPSGFNEPGDIERDPDVREVLDAGLHGIVCEMAAVMHELDRRPDGLMALHEDDDEDEDDES